MTSGVIHHWWLALGPSPATAIAAGVAMAATCTLTWAGATRIEPFLKRGKRRVPVAGAVIGITLGVVTIALDVTFRTHNRAGVYVTVAGLLGVIAGLEAWSRTGHRRRTGTWSRRDARILRAQRRQRGYQ